MKIILKNQTKKFQNGKNCTAWEYPLGDKDINGAVIELSGRYPETGEVMNKVCKELAYVIKGEGRVVIENQEFNISKGDLVMIEPGEKYYWEGKMTMFVPCVPAWYPEQHQEIENR